MCVLSAPLGYLGTTYSNGSIRNTSFKQTASGDLTDPLKSIQKSLFVMELLLGMTYEFIEEQQLHAVSAGDFWKVCVSPHHT